MRNANPNLFQSEDIERTARAMRAVAALPSDSASRVQLAIDRESESHRVLDDAVQRLAQPYASGQIGVVGRAADVDANEVTLAALAVRAALNPHSNARQARLATLPAVFGTAN